MIRFCPPRFLIRLLPLFAGLALPAAVAAQVAVGAGPALKAGDPLPRPKLVVGIVIDQMRQDYLYRYWDKYAARGGFKRLLSEGFQYGQCHYNYVPTYTGPGHASIYTGATPSAHGIIGNDWFVREAGKATYVTADASPQVRPVGTESAAGKMSPRNLLTTTITDELRLADDRSRVVAVCLKDRGAILPAGHLASACYWYEGQEGKWISSTYYAPSGLPDWVNTYNGRKRADFYLSKPWETLLPLKKYTESTADDVPWEGLLPGEKAPVFPHDLPAIRKAGNAKVPMASQPPASYDLLRQTPFGNTFTLEFAKETLRQEKLGRGEATDFLALSFSSTDYVGHLYGPNSVEVEDTYLRLDRDLGELLDYLESEVGNGKTLVFLTADHGAAHAPGFSMARRLPGGSMGPVTMRDSLQRTLVRRYGAGQWVLAYDNQQVYLNRELIAEQKLALDVVQRDVADVMLRFAGVSRAISAQDLERSHWNDGLLMYLENGFLPRRSGDVIVVLEPGWMEGYNGPITRGTTHGSAGNHDTHVPLLFWGWGVKAGESAAPARITDIAPTVAEMLRIQEPSGCSGQPLREVLRR